MADKRAVFTFQVTYFKPSGKYYTSAFFDLEVDALGQYHKHPYTPEAVDHIKSLLGGSTGLPGLICHDWYGPILVESDPEGCPYLFNLNRKEPTNGEDQDSEVS